MKVVILAGGMGTRLAEETDRIPKPMVEIGGRPILWHIMKYYAAFGFDEFILALGYKGEVIKNYFVNYHLMQSDISVRLAGRQVDYRQSPRDDWTIHMVDTGLATMTGGRLKRLREWLGDETFLVTYGDGLSNVDLHEVLALHTRTRSLVTMTAVRPPARFGVISLEGDRVDRFDEKPTAAEGWINGGFFAMEPGALDYIEGDAMPFETEPMQRLLADGRLHAHRHGGFWHCMDTLRDVRSLNALWDRGEAPWKIWQDAPAAETAISRGPVIWRPRPKTTASRAG